MFGFNDLKQTKVYKEGRQEVQLQAIPTLLSMGLNVEQIARALGLTIEDVRRISNRLINSSKPESDAISDRFC